MNCDKFRSFLEYVYNEHIRQRIHRIGRYFDHLNMHKHMEYEWQGLKRALHIIEYIHTYCDDADDVYSTFKLERLRRAVDEIEDGVRWHNRLARETGFLDALDQYYAEIISGLNIEDFPEQEYEMLSEFGFQNPKVELQGIMYLLKMRQQEKVSRQNKKLCVSRELERTVEILSSAQKDFEEKDDNASEKVEPPKKSRRWFKGLGKIGQGAAMSIGDICLAAGVLKFPVSPETQTWGALVSATAGVGMVLDGLGELQGE